MKLVDIEETVVLVTGSSPAAEARDRPLADRLKAEIEAHGPIRHLVAPNIAHWSFLAEWQRQCPDAVTWAPPGLRERANVKASDVRLDRDLPSASPPEWAQDFEQAIIPGAAGFREVTFFHRPSRTLLLTDLVVNLEAGKLPLHARAFAWATIAAKRARS